MSHESDRHIPEKELSIKAEQLVHVIATHPLVEEIHTLQCNPLFPSMLSTVWQSWNEQGVIRKRSAYHVVSVFLRPTVIVPIETQVRKEPEITTRPVLSVEAYLEECSPFFLLDGSPKDHISMYLASITPCSAEEEMPLFADGMQMNGNITVQQREKEREKNSYYLRGEGLRYSMVVSDALSAYASIRVGYDRLHNALSFLYSEQIQDRRGKEVHVRSFHSPSLDTFRRDMDSYVAQQGFSTKDKKKR